MTLATYAYLIELCKGYIRIAEMLNDHAIKLETIMLLKLPFILLEQGSKILPNYAQIMLHKSTSCCQYLFKDICSFFNLSIS